VVLPYCSGLNEAVVDNGDSALAYAISIGKLQTARVLHTAGADVHCKVQSGSIAHAAAQSGKVAVVKWVQSVGLDLRGRNDNQELPLHYACCKEYNQERKSTMYRHCSCCTERGSSSCFLFGGGGE
jgi:hypothetical protein